MTITIGKKQVYGFIAIVLIGCCVFLGYKSCEKVDYESTAKDMKLNAMITTNIAGQILADYQKNWQSAISDKRAINAEGKYERCDEFSEAISWRYIYYVKNGHIKVLDSLANVVKEDMRIMENAPSRFEDTQKSFLALFNDMNTLISLVKNPKGSLMTFGQKINEILLDVEKRYNETDLKISISDSEKNEKLIAIQQVFNNIIANTPEMKAKKLAEKENEENKIRNEKFLEENSKKEGVITLTSGLQYKVIKEGSGVKPQESSLVRAHYEGRTIDGYVFDSSYKRGKPAEFRANQVIKGWTEALALMPAGSIWEVYIPNELAYEGRDQGNIKPYSTLIFKIELLKVLSSN